LKDNAVDCSLSVILPAHNEEEAIATTVHEVVETLSLRTHRCTQRARKDLQSIRITAQYAIVIAPVILGEKEAPAYPGINCRTPAAFSSIMRRSKS
jgi:hypothetical protein